MEEFEYILRVNCVTYNHSSYIKNALDGFCMQKTSFPFVCVIVDDASTDGEQSLLIQYLKTNFDIEDSQVAHREETDDFVKIFAQHKINRSCFFSVFLLKYNHYQANKSKRGYLDDTFRTKYVAMCEGDDYWIVPNKLQLQVDFLENHNDYGLVYTNTKVWREKTSELYDSPEDYHDGYVTEELLKFNFICTLTVCYRTSVLDLIDRSFEEQKFLMGDLPLWIEFSRHTKIGCIPVYTSVYRRLEDSASHSTSLRKTLLFRLNSLQAKLYFAEKYDYKKQTIVLKRNVCYVESLILCLDKKRPSAMMKYIKSHHFGLNDFKYFIRLLCLNNNNTNF